MPACAWIEYRLVGTGAALLHGVELPAADVDILVRERDGVEAIGAALSPFKCLSAPGWLPGSAQYYANYDVHGVEVQISTVEIETEADIHETFGRGPWEHFTSIPCGPHTVPTVALELRLVTELSRQRPDRYQPIIRHIRAKGCDIALIHRGMGAAGLPQDVRENVLKQLKETPAG
jgi:hypothetical protein